MHQTVVIYLNKIKNIEKIKNIKPKKNKDAQSVTYRDPK